MTARFLKNIAAYGIGQIFCRSVSVLLLPFFTRYLSVEDYGILSVLNLITTFAVSILTLGIGTAFSICYVDEALGKRKVVFTSFVIILMVSVLFLGICWPWAAETSFFLFKEYSYKNLILLTYFTALLHSLALPFSLYLQFNQQASRIAFITVLYTICMMALNIYTIVFLGMGLRGQVWAAFISTIILFLLYWLPVQSQVRGEFCFEIAKRLLWHGMPMIPASFSLFFLQNSQRFFLDQYSTMRELGLYAVGFNIASAANLLVSAFSQAWTPFFMAYKDKHEEGRIVFSRIFSYYSYSFGIVCLAFFILARPIVTLLAKPPFYPSANIVGVIALGWILLGYYNLMNIGITYAKKTYFNSFIQLAAVLIAYLGNLSFVPKYGMMGGAYVFLATHAALVLIQEICNRYFSFFRYPIEWPRLIPFGTLLALLAWAFY